MSDLRSAIEKLQASATFTPEYEGTDVPSAMEKHISALTRKYPQVRNHQSYLEFLRSTGGAHVHSPEYSFGIYGFGGYVVPDFEEANLVDQDRYYIFGDVLYSFKESPTYYFAFDLLSEGDTVYMASDEGDTYVRCCDSFVELLSSFGDGRYPGADDRP